MRTWIRKKDGVKYYTLPDCNICGRRSSTSDKETAQIAKTHGRICRACTKDIAFNKPKKPFWKRLLGL